MENNKEILNNSTRYDTPYGEIYINHNSKNVGLALSGGYDSAITLYLIAKTLTDKNSLETVVQPFTVIKRNPSDFRNYDRPDMFEYAKTVISYVKNKFPKVQINDCITQEAPYWWIAGNGGVNDDSYSGAVSNLERFIKWNSISKDTTKSGHDGSVLVMYDGVTMNPTDPSIPASDQKHRDVKADYSATGTSTTTISVEANNKIANYSPFRNFDKRASIWIGKELGVLDDLLSITRSCEGNSERTDGFTKPCNECWWCLEREWAVKSVMQE